MSGQKEHSGLALILIGAGLVTAIAFMNQWLQSQVDKVIVTKSHSLNQPVSFSDLSPAEVIPSSRRLNQEVIRKTRFSPGRDYRISIFYRGNEEIARWKTVEGKIIEQSGEVPEGKVKFLDESNNTYGHEYYQNGKKHGFEKTYYRDGRLYREENYWFGKLQTRREYYNTGALRLEINYEDARGDYREDKEVGAGKVYFSDGTLKYEWNFTTTHKEGFRKSYNRKGDLVAAFYYDEHGQLLNEIN